VDFKNLFNIKVLKCINLIFSLEAFKNNYANIILIIIIIVYFICLILFVFRYYKKEIKFYRDIIIYFKLFPIKFSFIEETKKKELKTLRRDKEKNDKMNNIDNSSNKINEISNENKKHSKNIRMGKSKQFKKENRNIKNTENTKETPSLKMKFKGINLKSNPNKKKKQINSKELKNNIKEEDDLNKKIKLEKKFKKKYSFNKFNNSKKIYEVYKKIFNRTDNELNDLSYIDALKIDKRTYCEYYFSLIRSKNLLFFSFHPKFDFNSRIIKIYLFFFDFATNFFVNALFFTDETMGKINKDKGAFNFIYNLPQTIYSCIISNIVIETINMLALSEQNFIEYKNKTKILKISKAARRLTKYLKMKFVLFFFLNLILLGLYWIYLSCFSAVYKNTQIHLIKDTLISFGTTFIIPFGIYLIYGIFRILALKNDKRRIIYMINRILQLF